MAGGQHESTRGPLFAKVVVGVDGTAPSLQALEQVAPLVAAAGGEIIVVFVRHLRAMAEAGAGEAIGVIEDTLEEIAQQVRHDAEELLAPLGVARSFAEHDGDPAQELTAVAHQVGASLVVVEARTHGAVASLFLSSVASHLVHHCDVPVLVLRPSTEAA